MRPVAERDGGDTAVSPVGGLMLAVPLFRVPRLPGADNRSYLKGARGSGWLGGGRWVARRSLGRGWLASGAGGAELWRSEEESWQRPEGSRWGRGRWARADARRSTHEKEEALRGGVLPIVCKVALLNVVVSS
jgi:hypothetical protein